jgi:hypothetical protein
VPASGVMESFGGKASACVWRARHSSFVCERRIYAGLIQPHAQLCVVLSLSLSLALFLSHRTVVKNSKIPCRSRNMNNARARVRERNEKFLFWEEWERGEEKADCVKKASSSSSGGFSNQTFVVLVRLLFFYKPLVTHISNVKIFLSSLRSCTRAMCACACPRL